MISSDVTSSIISGALTQLLTNPIWVAKTRLQCQKLHGVQDYRNVFDGMHKVFQREGVYGLYKGVTVSMIGTLHFVIYMPLYDYLNREYTNMFRNKGQESGEQSKQPFCFHLFRIITDAILGWKDLK